MTKTAPMILAAAALAVLAAAASATEGQKLDSGLGALPHYSKWLDKSGRNPMVASVPGESLDDGLGQLPHYAKWLDKTGRDPMGTRGAIVASSR